MREILFRGKISNGKWSYGNFVQKFGENFITPIDSSIETYGTVNPQTVGQYTGLKDKNGKRIFEGDILALWTGRPYIVSFDHGTFALTDTAVPIRYSDKFEIIGNIHDNPELLKGGPHE